jgi:ribosome-binding factor A
LRSTHLKKTDDLLRRVISETLLTKVQDPRIGIVSVTQVETSPEYDTARVFVSIYGDEAARAESLKGLKSAAPFLQAELAKAVRLRRTPRLRFIYDESIERGFRIDETLRNLKEAAGEVESNSEREADPDS